MAFLQVVNRVFATREFGDKPLCVISASGDIQSLDIGEFSAEEYAHCCLDMAAIDKANGCKMELARECFLMESLSEPRDQEVNVGAWNLTNVKWIGSAILCHRSYLE